MKKKFLRKTGLSEKPEYPENRETSETFFPDSFLKFKSTKQQINSKKLIFCIRHVPKLNRFCDKKFCKKKFCKKKFCKKKILPYIITHWGASLNMISQYEIL